MYGGQYNPTDPPERNGIFINTITVDSPTTRTGANGVVGIIGKADWGPDSTIIDITSSRQALDTFGAGDLYFAIDRALAGPGLEDRSGAITVRAYRIADNTAAVATVTLQNTAPANALTISSKYKGTRGNSFRITTQTNAIDSSKRDLIVLEGTVIRETYVYDGTGSTILAELATNINSQSNYITAAVVADGTPLGAALNTPLTSGNSGTSPSSGDHLAARTAFENSANFTAFALDDFAALGAPEQAAYRDWAVRLVREGKTFHLVIGGLASETAATALARSVTMDTPESGSVEGVGDVVINTTRDLRIGGVVYSSSKLAPGIAGIVASADYRRSISGTPIVGAELVNSPSSAQVEALVRGGVVPYVNDGTLVRLDRGRTAYATAVPPTENKSDDFRSVLFVRKLWYTFDRMQQLVSNEITGQPIFNTPEMVDVILGRFAALLKDLQEENVTIPGATVDLDPSKDNTKETLHLLFKYAPAPGIEQVLAIVTVPV